MRLPRFLLIVFAGILAFSCSKGKGGEVPRADGFNTAALTGQPHEEGASGTDSPAAPSAVTDGIQAHLEEQRQRCKEGDIPLKVLMDSWAMVPGDRLVTYMVCRRGIREGAGLAACDELPEPMRESSRGRCVQLLEAVNDFIVPAVKDGKCSLPAEPGCTGECAKSLPQLCSAIHRSDPSFCSQLSGADGMKCRGIVLGDPRQCPESDDTALGISSCTDLANAVQAAREGRIRSMPNELDRSTFARLTLARANGEVCEALLRDHIQTEFCEQRF